MYTQRFILYYNYILNLNIINKNDCLFSEEQNVKLIFRKLFPREHKLKIESEDQILKLLNAIP